MNSQDGDIPIVFINRATVENNEELICSNDNPSSEVTPGENVNSTEELQIHSRIEDDPASSKMSMLKATFTLLCQLMGGSDLSLPYAVSQGGIAVLAVLVILPFFCSYTALILIKCMYKTDPITRKKERERSSYSDLSEACWGEYGRKVTFLLQSLVLILVSSLYLVLCGSFLTHAFATLQLTKRTWTAIGTIVILPLVFLKSLSKLAWASVVGVVVIVIPIVIVVCFSFANVEEWDAKCLIFIHTEGIPVGVNIVLFTYGGHAVLPRIEKGMANPKEYYEVILNNYILGTIFKFLLALVGYLMFTSSTQQLVTNNLPPGVWTIIVSCSLGLKVLCSYPFLMYVVCNEVELMLSTSCCSIVKLFPRVRYFCIRFFLVLLTLCLAVLVPQFGTLIAFIGSIGASMFVFCLPGLYNLLLRRNEISTFEKVLNVFIIIFGLCCCIFGLYFTSKALASKYTT